MFLRQKSWDKGEIFLGQDKVVATGFSQRLFAQVKTCGYHDLFVQPKGYSYLHERYCEKQINGEEK